MKSRNLTCQKRAPEESAGLGRIQRIIRDCGTVEARREREQDGGEERWKRQRDDEIRGGGGEEKGERQHAHRERKRGNKEGRRSRTVI